MTPQAEPTQRQFLNLALPNMLAAMAVPVAELVDLTFLGHLPDISQLSGAVLAMVIFDYIFWCFGFLRMGTTGLVAQAMGANDNTEQASLFWRGILAALFFGVILLILQTPIALGSFALLAGESSVEGAARDYYFAHIWGSIPTLVNYACIGWLLGRSNSRDVLIISIIWQGANIALDYLFIIRFGWGAAGAGYAIMLADWAGMVASLFLVVRSWGGMPPFDAAQIRRWARLKQLLSLNSSILLRTFLLISMLAIFTNLSAAMGTVLLAANALLLRLWTLFSYVTDGFAVALETLAGKYYGAGDHPALRRATTLALKWNVAVTFAFIVAYGLAGEFILGLLTSHADVIARAEHYLPWLLLCLISGGFAFIYDGFFFGLARAGLLLKSMLFAMTVFALAAAAAWYSNSVHLLWLALWLMTAGRALTLWLPARTLLRTEA